jgi:hypothetical protein
MRSFGTSFDIIERSSDLNAQQIAITVLGRRREVMPRLDSRGGRERTDGREPAPGAR